MTKCLMDNLNEEQRYAVHFNGKHLLVLAGAGTGKTHTIISRARKLIEEDGVDPKRIVILSFTRKSAQEIASRIKVGLDSSITKGLIGRTFHSWCNELIHSFKNAFFAENFILMDEDDRESCFKLLYGRKVQKIEGEKISPKEISSVFSFMVNKQCSLSDAIRNKYVGLRQKDNNGEYISDISEYKTFFEEIIRKYITYKNEHRYLDYDDLLLIVSKTLKQNNKIRDFVTSRFDHILVDEMQDTNPLQYELLSSFYEKCHLFCVGDDAQSIYGFRGADFETIHNFTSTVPDSKACKLTLNYRSTQELLDLSNWLLEQSPLNYDKKLKAFRGSGNKPVFIHYDNEWDQANDITDKILNSVHMENMKFKNNMVISRTTFGLREVEGCCVRKKIPYMLFGGSGLMQSAHVRDVASAMRIVANHRDELAWMRYLMLWKGIGEVTASKIIGKILKAHSLDESLMVLRAEKIDNEISDVLIGFSDCMNNVVMAIDGALKGMEKLLERKYESQWGEWRKNDFTILKEVALECGNISEFIAEYVLDPRAETTLKGQSKKEDCVILTTIHQSKGLEAEHCYIVNVSPFSYPSSRAVSEGEESVEEERRCLYVAMTRAKDSLFLYRNAITAHVQTSSEDTNNNDKYFLNGISENLAEYVYIGKQQQLNTLYQQEPPQLDLESFYNFE